MLDFGQLFALLSEAISRHNLKKTLGKPKSDKQPLRKIEPVSKF